MNNIIQKDATDIIKQNYIEYSQYVISTRSYPNIRDGCKSVHRRCIYASYKGLPRHLVKSTNAIGEIVKYHPHPSSIYDTLVGMASKYNCPFPIFDTKGNFGDKVNPPAAERYTELMLSDLAIKIFCIFSDYSDMVLGETDVQEPESLPVLLPLCFLQGCYGIPVGMSVVNIPPLNPIDLLKYYIDVLKHKDINYTSNVFIKPNLGNINILNTKNDWQNLLNTGEGIIKYSTVYSVINSGKTIKITGLPKNKSISDLFKIFSSEVEKEQIDIRDESTKDINISIDILPYQRINYKYICDKIDKELTQSVKYKFIFSDGGYAVYASFKDVVKVNLEYLLKCVKKKIQENLCNINNRLFVLNVIELIKKDGIKKLTSLSNEDAEKYLVTKYKTTLEIAKVVLSKPISYLTKEHEKEIENLNQEKECLLNTDEYDYLLALYEDVLSVVKKLYKNISVNFERK